MGKVQHMRPIARQERSDPGSQESEWVGSKASQESEQVGSEATREVRSRSESGAKQVKSRSEAGVKWLRKLEDGVSQEKRKSGVKVRWERSESASRETKWVGSEASQESERGGSEATQEVRSRSKLGAWGPQRRFLSKVVTFGLLTASPDDSSCTRGVLYGNFLQQLSPNCPAADIMGGQSQWVKNFGDVI